MMQSSPILALLLIAAFSVAAGAPLVSAQEVVFAACPNANIVFPQPPTGNGSAFACYDDTTVSMRDVQTGSILWRRTIANLNASGPSNAAIFFRTNNQIGPLYFYIAGAALSVQVRGEVVWTNDLGHSCDGSYYGALLQISIRQSRLVVACFVDMMVTVGILDTRNGILLGDRRHKIPRWRFSNFGPVFHNKYKSENIFPAMVDDMLSLYDVAFGERVQQPVNLSAYCIPAHDPARLVTPVTAANVANSMSYMFAMAGSQHLVFMSNRPEEAALNNNDNGVVVVSIATDAAVLSNVALISTTPITEPVSLLVAYAAADGHIRIASVRNQTTNGSAELIAQTIWSSPRSYDLLPTSMGAGLTCCHGAVFFAVRRSGGFLARTRNHIIIVEVAPTPVIIFESTTRFLPIQAVAGNIDGSVFAVQQQQQQQQSGAASAVFLIDEKGEVMNQLMVPPPEQVGEPPATLRSMISYSTTRVGLIFDTCGLVVYDL